MNKKNNVSFVIHAPSYNETSGGIIVLHKLCHVLNNIGYPAYLKPNTHGTKLTTLKRVRSIIRKKEFKVNPNWNTPLIDKIDPTNHIIVYPETDFGNPLNANHIVRWLLHKPGFHTGEVNYSKDELFYIFDDYCIEPGYNINPDNKLSVLSIDSNYKMPDPATGRSGSCYMLRKSKQRKIIHDTTDSLLIDGFSHIDTAQAFKQKKYFYCYDEFTLYAQYAALCGCIPIVMPEKFKTRQEWVEKHPISKYGIAYGFDDIEHAITTQNRVVEYFEKLEQDSLEQVRKFAEASIEHFNLD